ncbi:hypothetical protein [Clavibacter michiganensis]|uniref:hypothetical protein n=1 Tax=Clavibacter michiganensis TaxID=28447 RepID=UPI001BDF97FF|nr:hypothetical protein [Clavibacter michiganensis]MBT1634612.1 hypothetical protein [Clavibacter michiganensis]
MDNILALLNQIPGVEEVWEERHFTIYRNRRELTITVSDQGPAAGAQRYSATAETAGEGGGEPIVKNGNSAATIDDALNNIDWWMFD